MNFRSKRLQKKKPPVIKRLVSILVIIGMIFGFGFFRFLSTPIVEKDEILSIQKGETLRSIEKTIPGFYGLYGKIYRKIYQENFKLKEGSYKIKKGDSITDIYTALKKPVFQEDTVTILEGWNIFDIDEYLANKGIIQKGEYIQVVTDKKEIKSLAESYAFLQKEGLESLEGFLYPDTYKIDKNKKIDNFIISQLNNFNKLIYNKILKNKRNSDIYELLILSSIVEKEEKVEKYKPVVAGILKKRLENNWMIGADATVCYPYKLTSEECKLVVSKYIAEKNNYNTRTMLGLPKTPIANPSFETIYHTLNSKDSEYWFYLHNKSGKIFYGKTNKEHNYNKKTYMNNY